MAFLDKLRRKVSSRRSYIWGSKDAVVPETAEEAMARLSQSMETLKNLADLKEEVIAGDVAQRSSDGGRSSPVPKPAERKRKRVAEHVDLDSSGWAPMATRGEVRVFRTPERQAARPVGVVPVIDLDLRSRVSQVFSPSAPVSQRDLFAGRTRQMEELVDTVYERGQHAVIYGERGVGKTSLASVMSQVLAQSGATVVRVNCDGADDFSSVWRKILAEISTAGSVPADALETRSVLDGHTAKERLAPNDVRHVLQSLAQHGDHVIFIDEFDTLRDPGIHGLMADTIKTLSDQLVPSTLVMIGVADNLDELIAEHASIRRALSQIHMPRMSHGELAEIVGRGLRHLDLACEGTALRRIAQISQGFPYYTKLLAQAAARDVLSKGGAGISLEDVDNALDKVAGRVHETIRGLYNQATRGPKTGLYQRALRAGALSRWDERGYFGIDDAAAIWKKTTKAGSGSVRTLLTDLTKVERGQAIEMKKGLGGVRYRFTTPLLQPYVLMEGLLSGDLTAEQLDELTQSS